MKLRDMLEDLLENGPKYPEYGICGNVQQMGTYDVDLELRGLLQKLYPGQHHPIEGSWKAYRANKNKWAGTARKELLKELLDELT